MARLKYSTEREHDGRASNVPTLRTSERSSYRKCPQQWWWGYRQGLKAKTEALPLWFGTGIHLALAEWYIPGKTRGVDPLVTWAEYCKDEYAKVKTFNTDDSPEYVEARELGTEMLKGYIKKWKEEDASWRIVQPEWSAQVAIPDEDGEPMVNYALTVDGVYFDMDDRQYKILETKTAAAVNLWKLTMDDQTGSYLPIMSAFLMDRGVIQEPIATVRYNVLRKALPKEDDRPRNAEGLALNKDGSVSKNQGAQAPLFVREDVTRTRHERAGQINRIRKEVRAMNWMREDPENRVFKSQGEHCQWCPFVEMCQLHESGGDWETLRDWQFDVRDPYADHRKAA